MSNLFRSEFLKLRTTRAVLWLTLALIALVGLAAAAATALTDVFELDDVGWQADLASSAATALGFAFLFGILVMTGEFRHGTITPTFLVSPRRERVVVAKALAAMVGGAVLVVLAAAIVYAVAIPWLLARGIEIRLFEGEPLEEIGVLVVTGALSGGLGVGLGAIVRSQVAAIVGTLVWFFVLEGIVGLLLDGVGPYLPGAAFLSLAFDEGDLSRLGGLATSGAYTAAFCAAGVALVARRDIA